MTSGPDLIVPTRTGFRRVCVIPVDTTDGNEHYVTDTLYVGAATLPCGGLHSVVADSTAKTASVPNDTIAISTCEMNLTIEIGFISESAIATQEHSDSNCGAHPSGDTRNLIRTLGGRKLDLAAYLSASAKGKLYARALAAGVKKLGDFGIFAEETTRSPAEDVAHLGLENEWGVERGVANWNVTELASCFPHVACGEENIPFTVTGFTAPAGLVGHDILVPALAKLKAQFPRLRDAMTSPRGDMTVVITDGSLIVFTPHAGALGPPVFRQKFDGDRVVMMQWALGRFVPLWTHQLTDIFNVH